MNAEYSGNYSCAIALIAACAVLTGCKATLTQVKVPVPVECREQVPDRPVMPTESLAPGVAAWELLRAALSEIDRREAYEIKLRAGLVACTTPIERLQ